ncbi:MAG: YbaB/EbfC family nucleoid-associated protein [Actinomycetota bacterium]|nr:YbaB/EbfC family nucleoid-associated protein [Actinomycetota bacterium]
MSDMGQMLQQAQALQAKLGEAQEELAGTDVSGSAGGGMVTVVVSGDGALRSVTIAPEAVDPDDVDMLQDMVTAAVNDALQRAEALKQEKLGALTGGLGLPPGMT